MSDPIRPASTSTVHIWLIIAAYGLACIPSFIYMVTFNVGDYMRVMLDYTSPFAIYELMLTPAYWATIAASFLAYALTALLAYFDYRELTARGVDRPFHWAFSLIPTSSTWIYVIGRSIVLHLRGLRGWAPLWVFLAVNVVTTAIGAWAAAVFLGSFFNAMQSSIFELTP